LEACFVKGIVSCRFEKARTDTTLVDEDGEIQTSLCLVDVDGIGNRFFTLGYGDGCPREDKRIVTVRVDFGNELFLDVAFENDFQARREFDIKERLICGRVDL
jgi:hypothetical protein